MLIVIKDRAAIAEIKENLHGNFLMKELGNAQQILGMRIEWNQLRKMLQLFQEDYVQKVLRILNMENLKPTGI